MEPDRAVADLESFLAERGQPLLRTAVLLTGSREAGEDLLGLAGGAGPIACGPGIQPGPGPGNGWPAFIRGQLKCGEFAVTGGSSPIRRGRRPEVYGQEKDRRHP